MARLPFDPSKAAGSSPPSEEGPLTVSRLAALVARAVEGAVPRKIAVIGEVSQPRESTHLYCTLKDASAGVQAVMFAAKLRRAAVRPEHGQQVIAHGQLSYYEPQGRVSLIVDRFELLGRGALEEQLRQLADELRQLGWFDEDRKRILPTLPRCVAVITSASGAALQDVLDTLRRRSRAVEVIVVPAVMQGERSAADVQRALRWCTDHRSEHSIDAVIITRGGGSLEDLWSFNDRALAQAVLESPIPIVAAIGHETDTTIIELVADLRAATPTQAAMRVTPEADALLRQLQQSQQRLTSALERTISDARRRIREIEQRSVLASGQALLLPARGRLEDASQKLHSRILRVVEQRQGQLDRLALRLERHKPATLTARRAERLVAARRRLERTMSTLLQQHRQALRAAERELHAVSPQAVLARGYTCTMHERGGLIRSAADVSVGDRVRTLTADGGFDSTVRRPRAPGASLPPPRESGHAPATADDSQNLFAQADEP